jgi:hypothetical protein
LRLAKLKIIFDKIEEFLSMSATMAAIISFVRLNVFVLYAIFLLNVLGFGRIGLDAYFILLLRMKIKS